MVSKDEQTAEMQENKDGRKTQSCLQECCFSQATDKLKDRSSFPSGWGRAAEAAVERALVPAALPWENFHPLPPAVPDPPQSPT